MTTKWIETITGDLVRWSDITRIDYQLTNWGDGDRKRDEYASYFKMKDGGEKDFIDHHNIENLDASEILVIHRKAINEIEKSQDLVIRMWDVIESVETHKDDGEA